MKYNIGDTVKIRAGLTIGAKYGGITFVSYMKKYEGTKLTITDFIATPETVMCSQPKIMYKVKEANFIFSESMLEHYSEERIEERIIEIRVRGNKVTARERGKVGVARCSPLDKFNLSEGARLAIERMENDWPAEGDICYTVGMNQYGFFYVKEETYHEQHGFHEARKRRKLYFHTEEEARAFAIRMVEFVIKDRGIE